MTTPLLHAYINILCSLVSSMLEDLNLIIWRFIYALPASFIWTSFKRRNASNNVLCCTNILLESLSVTKKS